MNRAASAFRTRADPIPSPGADVPPQVITAPGQTVRQVSGELPDKGPILSVLVKRTYQIDPRGRCVRAAVQLPLQEEVAYADEAEEEISADTDLAPWKPLTDIVVRGHGYARAPASEIGVGVRVGTHTKLVTASGARQVTLSAAGRPLFSRPEPFTKIPLSFSLAYGGRDRAAEAKYGNPAEKFSRFLPTGMRMDHLSPYLYPRNPIGTGYLVELSRPAVEGLVMPRLEDPEDRLTPERLAAGEWHRWAEMPVPQSLGWLGHSWFPRATYFGVVPMHQPPPRPIFEVRKGWAPPDVLVNKVITRGFDIRVTNGASLGLQVPRLSGAENGSLHNLSPISEVVRFKLPGEAPEIWTDARKGKLNKTEPVIDTLLIEPDELRLSIVWRGTAPAIRHYMREELASMPLRVSW